MDKDYWKRVARTAVIVALALILGWVLWWHYMRSPWTRDGRVRAEVVDIAAQIAGQVVNLRVVDNQFVHRGDVLFIVDPDNYRLALEEAEATVQSRQADLAIRKQELKRRQDLGAQAISTEDIQLAQNAVTVAEASANDALAVRDLAKLNMDRTTVTSPVNGYVTNLHLRVGDYSTPGQTKLSIIDSDSFWVAGYFEETKLPRIHIGDYAHVKLMGVGPEIAGHVESFSRGIADANGGASGQGLASVDPIFTWVRLAQRIPVRIHIDHVPDGVKIAAGQTCTIVLGPPRKQEQVR
ncbi:MAG: HlyD family secretion protein [Methylacidiphilales bacterium]|nr:HlyD family secretion protein [Candidatus Methylacidiphilales bacterium]